MSPVPRKFSIAVVGVTFVPAYPANVLAVERRIFETGTCPVRLEREPHNVADPNAIAIMAEDIWLGHVPRSVAAWLAPEMDRGDMWAGEVTEVRSVRMERPGVTVTVERVQSPERRTDERKAG